MTFIHDEIRAAMFEDAMSYAEYCYRQSRGYDQDPFYDAFERWESFGGML